MIYTQKLRIIKKLRYTKMKITGLFTALMLCALTSVAQPKKVIDEVVAVVGNEIVLLSDIENQKLQAKQQGIVVNKATECMIVEQLLLEKLLLYQAKVDSVEVNEQQIQSELDRRVRYFVNQIGSEEKLEEFYQKSIVEIKEEFHDLIEDQMMIQGMQAKINQDISITPGEVQMFFNSISNFMGYLMPKPAL